MTSGETTIRTYLERLGARESVPGGGGASALAGAYGVSLGMMVCAFTIGKKTYAEVEPRIRDIEAALSDEDEKVFLPLSQAYGLPDSTPEEKDFKETTLETCLSTASMTPIKVMERVCEALDYLGELEAHGSKLMQSDVGVAAAYLGTALEGAVMNVYINTKMMKNQNRMIELNEYARKLLMDGRAKSRLIYEAVEDKVKPQYDPELDRIDRNKVDFS